METAANKTDVNARIFYLSVSAYITLKSTINIEKIQTTHANPIYVYYSGILLNYVVY